MKKLLVLILSIITIIMCVCFAGCEENNNTPIDTVQSTQNSVNSLFCLISKEEIDDITTIFVIYHKSTKIMYAITREYGSYGVSGISMVIMLDKNGEPLLYEGE